MKNDSASDSIILFLCGITFGVAVMSFILFSEEARFRKEYTEMLNDWQKCEVRLGEFERRLYERCK